MSKVFLAVFAAIVVTTVLGLDFYLQRQQNSDQPFGLADYISRRGGDIAVARATASEAFRPGASLSAALPTAMPGWEIHRFGPDDLPILTGAPATKEQAEGVSRQASNEALGMAVTKGVSKIDLALYKGEIGIRLVGIHLAASGGIATKALRRQNSFMQMFNAMEAPDPTLFLTVQGVQVMELPPKPDADQGLRKFRATLTDAITVTAVSRSQNDAALREVFSAVDFVQLNSLLSAPLPGIAADLGSVVPQAAPVLAKAASQPPAPPKAPVAKTAPKGTAKTQPKGKSKGDTPCVRKAGKLLCP